MGAGGGGIGGAYGGGIGGRPLRYAGRTGDDAAARMVLEETEKELIARGLTMTEIRQANGVVAKPMTQALVFWLGFLCGGAVVSLPWWLFWELT
jgi:hypothetical protein